MLYPHECSIHQRNKRKKRKQETISGGHNHKGAANHQLTLSDQQTYNSSHLHPSDHLPWPNMEEQGAPICACIMETTTTNARWGRHGTCGRETLHVGAALWLACVKLLEDDGHMGDRGGPVDYT
jgi:hypothetical protein